MIKEDIINELNNLQDIEYRDFQSKLIPTASVEHFIGVRTPELKSLAKKLAKREDIDEFLADVPHSYFDEYQLHAFIISEIKDYDKCVNAVNEFLPYVDNWATCDQMSPKVFKKHKSELFEMIKKWIASDETYTIRFGIKMLMSHFLDEDYDTVYPEMVSKVRNEEYYVKMMVAWYFATALAKQYDTVLPFIIEHKLDDWTHNKAIQKAVESNRISPEQKAYLKTLKVK
jgi:3-methyladenine DNA glycosylase AlkD